MSDSATPPSFVRRTSQRLKSAIGAVLAVLFFVGIAVYGVANAWTSFRTSCIGQLFFGSSAGPRVRAPNPEDPDDLRLVAPLFKAAQAAGLDLNELRVGIVEADIINAASLGQHTFLLFEGLSRLAPQHRDAVMAHEVAHDVLGHSDQSKSRYEYLSLALGVFKVLSGASGDAHDQVVSWTGGLAFPPYEKEAEFAADAKALDILRDMGYRKSARQVMAKALRALQDAVGDTGGGYFDSHPATSQRITAVEGGK